ncbi:unnamed protein product [Ixodes hexagonus]
MTALVFFILAGLCSAGVYKDVKGCTTEEVEKCGTEFVPYFSGQTLATSEAGLKQQCTKYIQELRCSIDFTNKCLDGLSKGAVLLMLKAADQEYSDVCNSTNPKHQAYLRTIGCLNQAGPFLSVCMNDMFVGLHRVSTKSPARMQIPYACCYYQDYAKCAGSALKTKCGSADATQFFNDIVDHVFGEVLNLACTKYTKDNGAACKALPVLSTKDDNHAKERGFIDPLAVIVGNLG